MIYINKKAWKRREYFDFFRKAHNPHYGVTVNVPVKVLLDSCQKRKRPFFYSFLYCLLKSVNQVDELKVRVVGNKLVQYPIVGPSFTVLNERGHFNFCTMDYTPDYSDFCANAQTASARVLKMKKLNLDDEHRLDVVYCTCLPWFSFTSISHAMHEPAHDFIPRLAWGKFYREGSKTLMPVSITVNHALVDGVHLGQFYQALEENLQKIKTTLR